MTSEGLGMERPVDTSATAGGRQNNRRVGLRIGEAKP